MTETPHTDAPDRNILSGQDLVLQEVHCSGGLAAAVADGMALLLFRVGFTDH